MGSYTALVFQAELNDLGLEVVNRLIEAREQQNFDAWRIALEPLGQGRWDTWPDFYRSSFVPFHLGSMRVEVEAFLEEMGWTPGLEGRMWTIACDLKDQGVINHFMCFVMCYLIKSELTSYTRNEDDREEWGWEKSWLEPRRIRRSTGGLAPLMTNPGATAVATSTNPTLRLFAYLGQCNVSMMLPDPKDHSQLKKFSTPYSHWGYVDFEDVPPQARRIQHESLNVSLEFEEPTWVPSMGVMAARVTNPADIQGVQGKWEIKDGNQNESYADGFKPVIAKLAGTLDTPRYLEWADHKIVAVAKTLFPTISKRRAGWI